MAVISFRNIRILYQKLGRFSDFIGLTFVINLFSQLAEKIGYGLLFNLFIAVFFPVYFIKNVLLQIVLIFTPKLHQYLHSLSIKNKRMKAIFQNVVLAPINFLNRIVSIVHIVISTVWVMVVRAFTILFPPLLAFALDAYQFILHPVTSFNEWALFRGSMKLLVEPVDLNHILGFNEKKIGFMENLKMILIFWRHF